MAKLKQLKVKIKSLACESNIIRLEERKAKKFKQTALLNDLTEHRKNAVREHSRYALLTYAYLRGKSYSKTEAKNSKAISVTRLTKEIKRFFESYSGPPGVLEEDAIKLWLKI